MNEKFPTEDCHENLNAFLKELSDTRDKLDDEILDQLGKQYASKSESENSMKVVNSSIQNLFLKIQQIQIKAGESESLVQEICSDIKQLDTAKTNLQITITALKKMQMLLNATSQLEQVAKDRQYQQAGNLLFAVKQLFNYFENNLSVSKLADMFELYQSIQTDLVDQVFRDFQAVGSWENENNSILKGLRASCSVFEGLDAKIRLQLIKVFCKEQLGAYDDLFGKNGPNADIENIDRRFPWYIRFMKDLMPKMEIVFPEHWNMPKRISLAFCEATKDHIVMEFEKQDPDAINVTSLLKALQKTLAFEKDVEKRFSANCDIKNVEFDTLPSFIGTISGAFDPYMTSYVSLERNNMAELLENFARKEKVARDGTLPVLASSVDLFVYIRNAVNRCTALSNGQTFFNLQLEFKSCLAQYARELKLCHKKIKSLESNEQEVACTIINTCEYCTDTLPSLSDLIQKKINHAYADAIDFIDEADLFHDVAVDAMKVLVSSMMGIFETHFTTMAGISWGTIGDAGDESEYVSTICQELKSCMPELYSMLPSLYYNNFCDKFISSFLPMQLNTILNMKNINENGSQQLLVDTKALESILKKLHTYGSTDALPPPRYIKMVSQHIQRTISILQLINTPTSIIAKSFTEMLPGGTRDDLLKILTLKGTNKKEMSFIFETLGMPSTPTNTISSKRLTGIDMKESLKKNMQHFAKSNPFNLS